MREEVVALPHKYFEQSKSLSVLVDALVTARNLSREYMN